MLYVRENGGSEKEGWERRRGDGRERGPGIERRKKRMEEKEISSVCLCGVPASILLDTASWMQEGVSRDRDG